jgi:hypothetical protein
MELGDTALTGAWRGSARLAGVPSSPHRSGMFSGWCVT